MRGVEHMEEEDDDGKRRKRRWSKQMQDKMGTMTVKHSEIVVPFPLLMTWIRSASDSES